MTSVSDYCVLYHQIKTPIFFWCMQKLKYKSFIQPLEILQVKLIGTHRFNGLFYLTQ